MEEVGPGRRVVLYILLIAVLMVLQIAFLRSQGASVLRRLKLCICLGPKYLIIQRSTLGRKSDDKSRRTLVWSLSLLIENCWTHPRGPPDDHTFYITNNFKDRKSNFVPLRAANLFRKMHCFKYRLKKDSQMINASLSFFSIWHIAIVSQLTLIFQKELCY